MALRHLFEPIQNFLGNISYQNIYRGGISSISNHSKFGKNFQKAVFDKYWKGDRFVGKI
jgi:hypothetical protein